MVLKVLHYSMYRTHWNYQFYDSFLLQTASTLIGDYDSFTSVCLVLSTVAINLFVYAWMLVKIANVCTCVFVHTRTCLCMYASALPPTAQASLKLTPQNLRGSVLSPLGQLSHRGTPMALGTLRLWVQAGLTPRSDSLLHCFSVWHHSELQDGITTSVLYTKISPNTEDWWVLESWAWPSIRSCC